MRTLVFLFLIAMLALPALAQPGQFATPADAELDKFPIMDGPLSTREMADMKLAPMILKQPVVFQNHFRSLKGKEGRFVLEELPAGTMVLVDTKAEIRYKADCGNRIVKVLPCPSCTEQQGTGEVVKDKSGKTKNLGDLPPETPGAWSRFWNNASKAWESGWGGLGYLIGILLPLLLGLALLALIVYLIYRAIQNRRQAGQTQSATASVSTTSAPTQPQVQNLRRGTLTQEVPTAPPGPQAVPPTAQKAGERMNKAHGSRFRFTMKDGNIFSRMEGYGNLRVDEDADGNISINADRV